MFRNEKCDDVTTVSGGSGESMVVWGHTGDSPHVSYYIDIYVG